MVAVYTIIVFSAFGLFHILQMSDAMHHVLGCSSLNVFAEGILLAVPDKYPEQQWGC